MNILSILGPTATGKSDIAFEVARQIGAEIISCDSMMVYKEMNIGTAKPARDVLQTIPHHLIDILNIDEPFDVNSYTLLAANAISRITRNDKIPLLCGGTGLYARALLYDYIFLPTDIRVKKRVQHDLKNQGKDRLINELAEIDPAQARLVRDNTRRLIRSVEIVRITGQSISSSTRQRLQLKSSGYQFILSVEPRFLREKITERTKKMIKNGWIDETENLIQNGLLSSPTASKALGYSLIADYLVGKIETKTELIEKIITRTSQFAKRQRTWFRHQHPNSILLNLDETTTHNQTVDKILSHAKLGFI